MSDLEMNFCGKPLPLDDEESVDNLIAYLQVLKTQLQARKTLLAFAGRVRTYGNETPETFAPTIPSEDISDEPVLHVPHSDKKNYETANSEAGNRESTRLIDWFEQAWNALGQPAKGATGDEFFAALLQLGYQPTSENPKAAIKTSIRINPRFRKVGSTASNAALWKLQPRSSTAPPQSSPDKPKGYKGPTNNQSPAPGKRVIDYVLRAMNSFDDGVTTQHLVERMKEQGWETSGDPLTTVSSTMRKPRYKNFFGRHNGIWVLNGDKDEETEKLLAEGKPASEHPTFDIEAENAGN